MYNLVYKQVSSTIGAHVFNTTLLFIPTVTLASLAMGINTNPESYLTNNSYIYNHTSTLDQYNNPLTREFKNSDELLQSKVTEFYSTLLAVQEPLGEEFERVLYNNLWDLYES